jgi:hypothetical protein
MTAFVVAALAAQVRSTMTEHQPAGGAPPPMRLAPLMLVGRRIDGAWERSSSSRSRAWAAAGDAGFASQKGTSEGQPRETGLADTVSLGTIGKVKERRASLQGLADVHRKRARRRGVDLRRARPSRCGPGRDGSRTSRTAGLALTLPVAKPVPLRGVRCRHARPRRRDRHAPGQVPRRPRARASHLDTDAERDAAVRVLRRRLTHPGRTHPEELHRRRSAPHFPLVEPLQDPGSGP